VPYLSLADGRDYALFPRALRAPVPLHENGKLYTKLVAGETQLFFLTDLGVEYQLTPAGSSTPSPHMVIWRPSLPSGGDFVQTWDEVAAAIEAVKGFITVFLAEVSNFIPSTADVQCYGRTRFAPYTANIGAFPAMVVQDGGRLRNPWSFQGCGIAGEPTIRPFIVIDVPGSQLICREGGRCVLGAGATVPGVDVLADFCETASFEGASFDNQTGNPALGLVRLAPGNTFIDARIAAAGTGAPPGEYPANTFEGGAGGVFLQIYDASQAPVAQPLVTGFTLGIPMDYALGVTYQDGTTTPTLGAATVQAALDVLKRRVTGAGPTAGRPAIPADIDTGGSYFDTDLGIPVWSNGAIYVDAFGAPA